MSKLKYVASGVREDCDKLLNKFVGTGNITFEEFSRVWREMKFSLIYMGRSRERELIEFTAECFCIAMSMWESKNSFEMRVGSFFILYGLYIKQPGINREKIRITNEDWINLRNLIKESEERKTYDVLYIFSLLCQKNAFHFVYRPHLFGPRTSMMTSDAYEEDKRWHCITSQTRNLLRSTVLHHMSELHDKYQEAKQELDPSLCETLNLVKDNVANKAMVNVKKFLASKKLLVSDTTEESEVETCYDYDSESDIGARRIVLKEKMFRSRPTTTRSRRHRMVVSDESDVSPQKKRTKTVSR